MTDSLQGRGFFYGMAHARRAESIPEPAVPVTWFKHLAGAPRVALPLKLPQRFGSIGAALGTAPLESPPAMDGPTRIATLCMYTLGILRREMESMYQYRRAVPSPRCFHPTELYVWVPEGHGLVPGLYHYLPLSHALEQVRAAEAADWLGAAFGPEAERADLILLVASDFWRVAHLYGDFALRLAALDAGHAVENLSLLARTLGWQPVVRGFFHDEVLAASLGIDPEAEGVLAGVLLYKAEAPRDMAPARSLASIAIPPLPYTGVHTSGVPTADYCRRLRLMQREAAAVTAPLCSPAAVGAADMAAAGKAIPLPEGRDVPGDMRRLLLERNSGREYRGLTARADPIDLGTLATLLREPTRPPAESDLELTIPVPDLVVAPIQVDGLPVGFYHYRRERHDLLPLYVADDARERLIDVTATTGVNIASLSFQVFMVVPTDRAFAAAGARAFRLLHQRAGALTQRLGLLAAAFGLFCRPFLAFDTVKAERLLGITGSDQVVIYHALIGRNQYQGWQLDLSL